MPSRTILCEDCASEQDALQTGGATNISCTPIPERPGFCKLSWEWPKPAAAAETPAAGDAEPPAKKPSDGKSKSKRKPKP